MPNKRSREAIRQIKLDMRAMIKEYQEQKHRYPTNAELMNVFQSTDKTIIKFKHEIYEEDRKTMTELFGFEKVDNVRQAITDLKRNISFYRKIRDDKGDRREVRMKAAQYLEESQQKLAQLLDSGDEYLEIENESDITQKLFDWQEKEIPTAAEAEAAANIR
jgi:3-keto-L-gulonate-6-phosphate decarboxylase